MRLSWRKTAPVVAGLLAALSVFGARFVAPDAFGRLGVALFDAHQRAFPWRSPDGPVRILDIDDESLARIGQWPWPRTIVAEMIGAAQDAGASAIALDMVFSEPDRTSPRQLARFFGAADAAPKPGEATMPAIAAFPDWDETLGATIARGRVVTGFALRPEAGEGKAPVKSAIATIGTTPLGHIPAFARAIPNLAVIDRDAAGSGTFTVETGADDLIRRIPAIVSLGETILPSLALEALRVATDEDTVRVRAEMVGEVVEGFTARIGDLAVPLDRDGSFRLHHGAMPPDYVVPAWRLLDRETRAEAGARLSGRIVLVGTSATGLADLRPTPLTPFEPGVNLHARAIEQIIAGHFLSRPAWLAGLEFVLAIGLAVTIVLLAGLAPLGWSIAFGALVLGAAAIGPAYAFTRAGLLVDPSLGVLALVAGFGIANLVRTLVSERDGRKLKTAFTHYLSPALVAALARDPGQLKLGGEMREMTFLFTDLEGFTALIENAAPEAVVGLLNAYLDGMCRVAMDHGGTIDKIVGDALHVMFNAPLDQPDHAARAVTCALAIDAFAQGFRAWKAAEGLRFGATRIGVNTGPAVVGNFGGALRFDYTAHGDAITTAARLETANKTLGSRICVSGTTRARVSGIAFRPVGALTLRGKNRSVAVFEPLAAGSPVLAYLDAYTAVFAALESGDPAAHETIMALAAAHPDDAILALYARRIADGETSTAISA